MEIAFLRKETSKEGVKLYIYIFIYALAFAGSNLCFKRASSIEVKMITWWIWFGLGNMIGFLAPLTITLALREGQASWVFALAVGIGFLLLHGLLWMFYSEPISRLQGMGIFFVALGFIFMNWGKAL